MGHKVLKSESNACKIESNALSTESKSVKSIQYLGIGLKLDRTNFYRKFEVNFFGGPKSS